MPPVLTVSAQESRGLDALWDKIAEHKAMMTASGEFAARRGAQAVAWMHDLLQERLMAALQGDPAVAKRMGELEAEVRDGRRTPALAVTELVAMMGLGQRVAP
jgi:LAO/AO transport system kinase